MSQTKRVSERFKGLVPVANPSGKEEVIRQVLQDALMGMGVTDQVVDKAGNLLVRVPGDAFKETILLSAHMDSVPPCEGIVPMDDVRDGRAVICSEGKTILGADDKAGMAVILSVIEDLSAQGFKTNYPLELLFTVQEEVGLQGSKAFDMGQLKASYGYILDGEGSVGEIFNAGPSQELVEITFTGLASHAGMAPEKGVSAIEMAAAVCAAVPSGRITETLTANLGVMDGGKAINVVAPNCLVRGDARSHADDKLESLMATYESACRKVEEDFPGGKVAFSRQRRYQHFYVDPAHAVVTRTEAALKEMGIESKIVPMNIGSDAHVLNPGGLPTVVLGMGFHYSHSLGEYLFVEELEQVLALVRRLVA